MNNSEANQDVKVTPLMDEEIQPLADFASEHDTMAGSEIETPTQELTVSSEYSVSARELADQFMREDAGFVMVLAVIIALGWIIGKVTKKSPTERAKR